MSVCYDCKRALTLWRKTWPYKCPSCGKGPLCPDCADNAVPSARGKMGEIVGVCDFCLPKHSNLDFSREYDIITPADAAREAFETAAKAKAAQAAREALEAAAKVKAAAIEAAIKSGKAPGKVVAEAPPDTTAAEAEKPVVTDEEPIAVGSFDREVAKPDAAAFKVQGEPWVVLVHGGGGHRRMFRALALRLAAAGFRCLLPDLPGHGARYKMNFSPDLVAATLKKDIETHCAGQRPLYVGGSLGAYYGMELVGREPHLVSAAVMCAAAQNVGKTASLQTKSFLQLKYETSDVMTSQRVARQLIRQLIKHPHLDKGVVAEDMVMGGFYYRRRASICFSMRYLDSLGAVAKFHGPVLYLNGEEESRVQENRLLLVSKTNNAASGLYDFPKADHFFSHDKRFREDFERRVEEFLVAHAELVNQPPPAAAADEATADAAAGGEGAPLPPPAATHADPAAA